jgi:UDP-glucose 4-epimerase
LDFDARGGSRRALGLPDVVDRGPEHRAVRVLDLLIVTTAASGENSVLVVGGASFVASHALPRLVGSGEVYATCRDGVSPPATAGVRWIPGNLAGPDPTANWPRRCETVIYLAQSRAWRRFPEGAADVFDVNVRAVFHAAEYARRAGAARFIFASSGSVYGPSAIPVRERDRFDVTEPKQFYSAAKLAAELLLGSYASLLHVAILRLFVPYGDGESPDMLIPQLVRRVREGEPILLDGEDGMQINPVAVGDVAETIDRCRRLQRSATFNVAGPEVLTLRQIGGVIGGVVGREPKFEHRAGAAQMLVGDSGALREALGWAPGTSFDHGLRAWLQSGGPAASGS